MKTAISAPGEAPESKGPNPKIRLKYPLQIKWDTYTFRRDPEQPRFEGYVQGELSNALESERKMVVGPLFLSTGSPTVRIGPDDTITVLVEHGYATQTQVERAAKKISYIPKEETV